MMPASPYTDLDRPPLNARGLQRAVAVPGAVWRRVDVRTETGSTNADAAAAARAGEPEGLVVVAERQTDGRGRRGRSWTAPARAGLTLSVLLRPAVPDGERDLPAVPPRAYGWLPLLAGVALREAVVRLAEVDARLKWPNDLLVVDPSGGGEAKCAGILAEVVAGEQPDRPAVVVGIGLNVTTRVDELPDNPTGLPATSLRLAGAAATDRDPLLRALLRSFGDWYDRWRTAGGDVYGSGLHRAYVAGCATLGRQVRVLLPADAEVSGTATGIDDEGQLVVATAEGERTVAAGDVLHLR